METLITSGEARLWTVSRGEGAPMLLCNGGPGCCDYLQPVSAMLEDRARVIRWEQRGCGRSSAEGPYDLATTLDDMEAIRRHHGIDRWIVGGHSWGGDLALAYAWHHPERVAGIVAISGGLFVKDRSWSEAYHAGKAGRGEAQPAFAYPHNMEVNRVLNSSWRDFTHGADLWRRAAAIACPALWVCAENDIRPSWPEQQLAALLPRGEFRLIGGAEHVIWLSHAAELRSVLLDWWGRQDFRSAR